MAYLTVTEFREKSIMPGEDVDFLETYYPTFLTNLLEDWSAEIDARLAKRYDVPFDASSPPRVIQRWLTSLVTREAYLKRGAQATSEMDGLIISQAEKAEASILEAANSETGLYALPLKQSSPNTSGVTKGRPLVRSAKTPYDWPNNQGD